MCADRTRRRRRRRTAARRRRTPPARTAPRPASPPSPRTARAAPCPPRGRRRWSARRSRPTTTTARPSTSRPLARPAHVGSCAISAVHWVIASTNTRSKNSSSGVTRSTSPRRTAVRYGRWRQARTRRRSCHAVPGERTRRPGGRASQGRAAGARDPTSARRAAGGAGASFWASPSSDADLDRRRLTAASPRPVELGGEGLGRGGGRRRGCRGDGRGGACLGSGVPTWQWRRPSSEGVAAPRPPCGRHGSSGPARCRRSRPSRRRSLERRLAALPPRISSTARMYVRSVALPSPPAAVFLALLSCHMSHTPDVVRPIEQKPPDEVDSDTASRACGSACPFAEHRPSAIGRGTGAAGR